MRSPGSRVRVAVLVTLVIVSGGAADLGAGTSGSSSAVGLSLPEIRSDVGGRGGAGYPSAPELTSADPPNGTLTLNTTVITPNESLRLTVTANRGRVNLSKTCLPPYSIYRRVSGGWKLVYPTVCLPVLPFSPISEGETRSWNWSPQRIDAPPDDYRVAVPTHSGTLIQPFTLTGSNSGTLGVDLSTTRTRPGDTVHLALAMTNTGAGILENPAVRIDQIPGTWMLVNRSDDRATMTATEVTNGSRSVTWVWESLAAGRSVTPTITLQLPVNASSRVHTLSAVGVITTDATVDTSGPPRQDDVVLDTVTVPLTVGNATTITSVDRTITPTAAVPGNATTVVVRLRTTASLDRLSITETFATAFARARLQGVTVNGSPVSPVRSTVATDKLTVVLGRLAAGDTVTVTYTVTPPSSAMSGDTFTIEGIVTTPTGDLPIRQDTIATGVAGYAGSDDIVRTADLHRAIQDWLNHHIGTPFLRDVISAWVTGTPV